MSKARYFAVYERDTEGKFTVQLDAKFGIRLDQNDWPSEYVTVENPTERDRWGDLIRTKYVAINELRPDTYMLLPYRDKKWKFHTQIKLDEGELVCLPWTSLAPITDHYAHCGFTDAGEVAVAFYANEDHGQLNRKTVMKPGRYLTKFYPTLSGDEVRELVTKLDKAGEVRFTDTQEGLEYVYVNGPRSCMSHDVSDYSSSIHPVRVYAAGDLQLAYLSVHEIGDDNFKASARALVWPAKKRIGRVYGDEQRLIPALEKLGYSKGSLRGARLLRIEEGCGEGFICPYIDGETSVEDAGDFLTIGGSLSADSTNGLIEAGKWCPGLEDMVDADEAFHYVRDMEEYCSETFTDRECFYCDRLDAYFTFDHGSVEMDSGETWSQRAFDRYGATCERTDGNFDRYDMVRLEDTDELVSDAWAAENAYEHEGDWYSEPQEDEESKENAAKALAVVDYKAGDVVRFSKVSPLWNVRVGRDYTVTSVGGRYIRLRDDDNYEDGFDRSYLVLVKAAPVVAPMVDEDQLTLPLIAA
jgi:hypothetical protein